MSILYNCEQYNNFTIEEITKDLFTVPQGYYLAHCISNDFTCGAGIAKQFVKNFNIRNKLRRFIVPNDTNNHYENYVGQAILIDNVFNLITKLNFWDKPTYDCLQECIKSMKKYMIDNQITKLAIPQIGCGCDKLDWTIVKRIIIDTFNDTDIEVLVCFV